MDFLFEKYRDNPDRDRQVQIALDMWDAGAHLLTCTSDPKSPRFKVPTSAAWQTKRSARAEIEAWVRSGKFIGIMAPAASLGLSCVDIDNGVEFRTKAVETLGSLPLVAHESSRSKAGKCHFWYYTPDPVSSCKWAGGDIRSDSNHQVLLYNLDAVGAAWDIAKAGNAKAVDLSKLDGVASRSKILNVNEELVIETDSAGRPLPQDIDSADAAVPTEHRHDTMIAKIGRAVMQASTKRELDQRVMVITDAHRQALAEEEDAARKASIKTEIAGARAFADGAWAKKGSARKVETEIWAAVKTSRSKEEAWEAVKFDVDEYAQECAANGWPNHDRAREEMAEVLLRLWSTRKTREEQAATLEKHRKEADERANDIARQSQAQGFAFKFTVDSPWGTKQSWVEAAEKLGIRFRYNTFVEQGDVWVPESIFPKKYGGGRWTQMTDNLRAVVSMAIEKHAFARQVSGKRVEEKPVELNKHKETLARDFLFASNQWCPMKDYFDSLPPWCGEHIIHNSMERGGMMIDAGPFTQAAQSFLWLFVVRNCLYPGSSMREYIVLFGDNDCGKSKFVELALPPHLKQYYNGGFSLEGSLKVKLERSIGKALLECGEMGQGGAKDWNAVKQWLTLSEVSGERMAYKEFAKRHRLTATTVFTTNHPELPPTDDAVLSRFIWVKVLTRAERAKDEAGNDVELVWQHFNHLYDPARPELGTWRDQYFAQALAIVKGSAQTFEHEEEGVRQTRVECNPQWLPPGSKGKLIEWNKQAGATYTTEQSNLVEQLEIAMQILAEKFDYETLEGLYPNPEIQSAIAAVEDGAPFESWYDLLDQVKNGVGDTLMTERKMDRIRRVASTKSTANALRQMAERAGFEANRKIFRWGDGKDVVRGWEFVKSPTEAKFT